MSEIRRLNKEDAQELFVLRLRALQEYPEAFGSSYEDEVAMGIQIWETSLEDWVNRAFFGAFVEGKLVGMVMISRNLGKKQNHRMNIGAMYVASEQQKLGLGRALIQACIDHAKGIEGVKQIVLAVTVGNLGARKLYRRFGFVTWGVHPAFIVLDDEHVYDTEWMFLAL